MPLMTRQEILDKYGFDPGGESNTSIYSKNDSDSFRNEEVEPITLDIPKQGTQTLPIERAKAETSSGEGDVKETKETPSASVLPMAASGAVRGFVSDPLLLSGMAIAGLESAFTDKKFKESLYREGGLEAVQQHLQEYANDLEGDPEEKKRKIREYQASPEFFKFHTDQMGTVYGSGMKMAAAVNGLFGIAKTPEQETWQDDAAQILGSILIPSPAIVAKAVSKLAMATGKVVPKSADIAAKAIDSVILPGTSAGHYTPGVLAASGAVGLGINELGRELSGDPSITAGDAFSSRLPTGGFADPNTIDSSPRTAELGASIAALAAAAAGLSRAFRGKPEVSLNPIDSGGLNYEGQVARNAELMGMEPPIDPTLGRRISQAINEDAEVERLARDAGSRAEETARVAGNAPNVTADVTEREVQSALGMLTSRPARDAKVQNLYEGNMPDGYRMSVSLRDIETVAKEAGQEAVDRYRFGMVARNVSDTRLKGLHESQEAVEQAQSALERAHRNNWAHVRIRELDIELQKRIETHNARLQDVEATRPNMQGWDDAKVDQYITDMMADPVARKLHDMHIQVNKELDSMLFRNGTMSRETYEQRLRTPWHTAMFETRGTRYDPKQQREVEIDPTELNVVVNKVIDPFQNLALRSAMAVDSVSFNQGKWKVINAIRAADPDGYYVREATEAGRGTVTVLDQGRERHFKFSRDSVAEALKFAPLSLGSLVQVANTGRRWFQRLTTGPWLGGIPTAINSLGYDIAAGFTARRAGRSFGYIGMHARMLAGDNKLANQLADTLDVVDLATIPIQVLASGIAATFHKTANRLGEELMQAAMGKGAFKELAGLASEQQLRSVGGLMVRAYEQSTVGVLRRAGAMQPHAMLSDTFGVKNRLERYVKESENAGRNVPQWKQNLRTIAEPYLALIDTVHNAGRYAFYAQNYAILEHKYGRNGIPRGELNRLIEETRRLAGDIQATGGSAAYNNAAAMVPYGNISAQATRHLVHAAFSQGSKHSFDVGIRLLGLGSAGYASVKLAEDMGMGDWYWNVQNQFERVGTLMFPTPEAIVHKASTGEWPTFDPQNPTKYVMRPRLAAELVPWTQSILTGLEAFGLFNRGSNLGKVTGGEDVLHAIGGALNVGNLQVINVPSILMGGPKLDLMNPTRGRPVAQDLKGPRGEGIHSGSTPGGIPVKVQELFKSVLGFAGDVIISSTDAGLQKYERSGNIFDSLLRAGEEVHQKVIRERMPTVPTLWSGDTKVYTSTPIGSRIREVDALQKQLDEQYKMEFGKSGPRYPERPRVIDPDANAMLATSHAFLSRGPYKKLADQLSMTQAELGQLEASKSRLSPDQIQVEKRKLMQTARSQQEQLIDVIGMHEDVLRTSFGPLFQRYNTQPTMEGARQVLLMTTRKEKAPN